MLQAEQFQLDLDAELLETKLRAQWAANMEAQANQWTLENMARCWAKFHEDDWAVLPNYEKQRIINDYQFEQDKLVSEQNYWDWKAQFGPQQTRRPNQIRDYQPPDWESIDARIKEQSARAQEMADLLTSDWSAGRPPSVYTYDPFLASEVSRILGKKIEAVIPDDPFGVPVHWLIISDLQGAKKMPPFNSVENE